MRVIKRDKWGHKVCKHGRKESHCKLCGGTQVCKHKRYRSQCKDCGGSQFCEQHGMARQHCKKCGTNRRFLKNGFTVDEVRKIGAVSQCQFPGCLVQDIDRSLHSDHDHSCKKKHVGFSAMCPECYRGEICWGHNVMLYDLDRHPEWANANAKEYMKRRPFHRRK